ncbi:ABC transporter permease [Iamia sp.]|uniref:ABC transporter permease n=1 Tax=Iamia sp. TaxID=2722710 RepID=UPI002D115CE5|nr:ABC transporter permease [Iamia sp.]HXH58897.1 ABC transporter permease [Iamia sp.]
MVRRPGGVIGVAMVGLLVGVGLIGPTVAPRDPFAIDGPSLASPSGTYPFGTDPLGRDVWSGVLHGARTSLLVAVTVALLVLAVGTAVGMAAGYRAGWVDDILMRITEFAQVLPRFFLAIVVIALFGPGLDRLIVVLGLTSWPLLARVVRAELLSLREREFVEAARADGAGTMRIVVRELLPNALAPALVVLGLVVAQVLLIEASLAFLGLGDPNAVSWGYLANQGQRVLRVAWWPAVFPGLAIVIAVLGCNLVADALNDALGARR